MMAVHCIKKTWYNVLARGGHLKLAGYILWIVALVSCQPALQDSIYVAMDGQDTNEGLEHDPLRTFEGAFERFRELQEINGPGVNTYRLVLADERYVIDKTILLTPISLKKDTSVQLIIEPKGEKAIISGAERITGWQQVEEQVWKVQVGAKRNINQLFAQGRRLPRARTPNEGFLYTKGPLSPYWETCSQWGTAPNEVRFPAKAKLAREHYDAFCGFQFQAGDLQEEPGWENAEVLVYHSWEASWHSVGKLDPATNDLWFHTPSRYPIGFFGNRTRYVVENLRSAMDRPGEWYYDYHQGDLFYRAREGEEVHAMDFFIPRMITLLEILGTAREKVTHLTFRNIHFQHTQGVRGFYGAQDVNWKEKHQKLFPGFEQDFRPGYMDAQAAPNAGSAIKVSFARDVAFDSCSFQHLGAYGMSIGRGAERVTLVHNLFSDMGAGGVLIGLDIREPIGAGVLTYEEAPQYITFRNNTIREGGVFYKSAVGIWLAQAHHNHITGNVIYNLPYTGISCGWTWNPVPNYTRHNVITRNVVHDVLKELADGGGIYTLGQQEGTIIRENIIYNIRRDPGAIGSHNNGMFFDESSSRFTVEQNHMFNIQDEPVRFNRSHPDSLRIAGNIENDGQLPAWFKKIDVHD